MRKAALPVLFVSFLLSGSPSRAQGEPPGAKAFSQCRKLPAGKKILKFNFKPDSEVADLIKWMSSITCTPFFTAENLQGKKVTVRTGAQPITVEEAYRLFVEALQSVDLTVQPEPEATAGRQGVLKIVKGAAR